MEVKEKNYYSVELKIVWFGIVGYAEGVDTRIGERFGEFYSAGEKITLIETVGVAFILVRVVIYY